MGYFVGSFVVFVLTALALSIGILFRGRTIHVGCGRLPEKSGCKLKMQCDGVCRWRR